METRLVLKKWIVICLVLLGSNQVSFATTLKFVATGDTPYYDAEMGLFHEMVARVNKGNGEFVLHIGDFKRSKAPCSDEYLLQRKSVLSTFTLPLVLIFGDNDWADCVRKKAGAHDPLDRLAFIREHFIFDTKKLAVERQCNETDYLPENFIYLKGDILMVGIHVLGHRDLVKIKDDKEERDARRAANMRWLSHAKSVAREHEVKAVVVAMHADPFLELKESSKKRKPYNKYVEYFNEWAQELDSKLLLIHGDTHFFRYNTPPFGNDKEFHFHRLEVFGSPFVGYVNVTVDTQAKSPFGVSSDLVLDY